MSDQDKNKGLLEYLLAELNAQLKEQAISSELLNKELKLLSDNMNDRLATVC